MFLRDLAPGPRRAVRGAVAVPGVAAGLQSRAGQARCHQTKRLPLFPTRVTDLLGDFRKGTSITSLCSRSPLAPISFLYLEYKDGWFC